MITSEFLNGMQMFVDNCPSWLGGDKRLFTQLIREYREQQEVIEGQRKLLQRLKPRWTQEELDECRRKGKEIYEQMTEMRAGV